MTSEIQGKEALVRIERKVDEVLRLLRVVVGTGLVGPDLVELEKAHEGGAVQEILRTMTVKQHAVLQILLMGGANKVIEDRFGVTTNTAKAYVRGLCKKFGASSRQELAMKVYPVVEHMDEGHYRVLSGGLPKHWSRTYQGPDEWTSLFNGQAGDGGE